MRFSSFPDRSTNVLVDVSPRGNFDLLGTRPSSGDSYPITVSSGGTTGRESGVQSLPGRYSPASRAAKSWSSSDGRLGGSGSSPTGETPRSAGPPLWVPTAETGDADDKGECPPSGDGWSPTSEDSPKVGRETGGNGSDIVADGSEREPKKARPGTKRRRRKVGRGTRQRSQEVGKLLRNDLIPDFPLRVCPSGPPTDRSSPGKHGLSERRETRDARRPGPPFSARDARDACPARGRRNHGPAVHPNGEARLRGIPRSSRCRSMPARKASEARPEERGGRLDTFLKTGKSR